MSDIVIRFVRVAASSLWAFLAAALLKYLGVAFSAEQSLAVEAAIIILLSGLVNAGIGAIGKRWPLAETLLICRTSPKYGEPKWR